MFFLVVMLYLFMIFGVGEVRRCLVMDITWEFLTFFFFFFFFSYFFIILNFLLLKFGVFYFKLVVVTLSLTRRLVFRSAKPPNESLLLFFIKSLDFHREPFQPETHFA